MTGRARIGSETASGRASAARDCARLWSVTDGPCPCGGLQGYDDCCGRLHRGVAHAPTAEALMRSRYSAFVVGDVAYLRETWHPHTRPASLELDPDRRWTGLEVTATSGGGV